MTQSQHTPGPWVVQSDAKGVYGIVVKQTSPIRTHQFIASLHDSMGEEERQANAHIISAAPDMLEALENLRIQLADIVENELPALLHDGLTSELLLSRLDSYTGKIAEVITKAKGEQ